MRLIGLTGSKNSGKGEVARFIAEWAAERSLLAVDRGFADKLKWAMARIFWPDITMQDAIVWANEFKNDSNAAVVVCDITDGEPRKVITGRELFQHGGTEMGRDIFGDTFWVDMLLPTTRLLINTWEDSFWTPEPEADPANIATISDVRFDEEANRITLLGGQIWAIHRPGCEPDGHASEVPLGDVHLTRVIPNNGSLDDLRAKVNKLCEETFA